MSQQEISMHPAENVGLQVRQTPEAAEALKRFHHQIITVSIRSSGQTFVLISKTLVTLGIPVVW